VTEDKGVATSWLEGLAAHGVRVTIRNGRLSMHPASAYKALTDVELIALRHHREAIKAAVREGFQATTTHEPAPAPEQTAAPEAVAEPAPPPPEPDCVYCGRRCVGLTHPAYEVLHFGDPAEIKKREEDAADQFEARARRWPTARMIAKAEAATPPLTEEEKQQAEVRRRFLGTGGELMTRKA
jgi:hypothetical protein